jgi:hypothetical protein
MQFERDETLYRRGERIFYAALVVRKALFVVKLTRR